MVNPGEDFGRFRSLRRLAAAGWAGRRRRWLLVWLVAWLGVPTEVDAGGLAVTGGAAAGGSALGLEVALGVTCTMARRVDSGSYVQRGFGFCL